MLRRVICNCRGTVSPLPVTRSAGKISRSFNSSSFRNNSPSSSAGSPPAHVEGDADQPRTQVPWFVDPSPPSTSTLTSAPPLPSSPKFVPIPPPSDLPSSLHALHTHLAVSPFLNPTTLVFINAREADPDNAWTEWIIIASLRKGREGGLRGAIEGVRVHLADSPITLSPSPAPSPFAPPSSTPLITGLPISLSSHARSRAKAPTSSRIEQNVDGWAMLDGGAIVVHVMTEESRSKFNLEALWKKIKDENQGVGKDRVEEF